MYQEVILIINSAGGSVAWCGGPPHVVSKRQHQHSPLTLVCEYARSLDSTHWIMHRSCAALCCAVLCCRTYADMAGEELVAKYQTLIFLAGSASAEFFADMALSPFEAVKVRGSRHGSNDRQQHQPPRSL